MGTITAQIQLTEAELKLLQTLVYQECGMFFDERRSHFLKDRLQRRLKACQLDSFYSYYRLLTSREGRAELALLLENLTVNETSFFRNKPQLDLLQKTVLEDLLRKKQERRDWNLRVWSAGCSAGQEALLRRHFDLRRACLLLSAQSASFRYAVSQAADSSALETGNRRFGHQLCESARRPGRRLHRNSKWSRSITPAACAISKSPATNTRSSRN